MSGPAPLPPVHRREPLLPNARTIARREFSERVRSRLFHASTALLAVLAVLVAFAPVLVRLVDRGTTTTIAVAASDDALADRAVAVMSGVLNAAGPDGSADGYDFVRAPAGEDLAAAVGDGRYDGAIVATRDADSGIDFRFLTGEGVGADRAQIVGIGTLAVAILDWTATNQVEGGTAFVMPSLEVIAAAGPTSGGAPVGPSEFAARRIVGIVFVVLIFITLVIYGMWVAAGVVAEKTSRVMELLISAASARQLIAGKVVGIGLAGLVQYLGVVIPALIALAVQGPVAALILGTSTVGGLNLAVLSPGLLVAYGLFFVLGFTLYALVYAAAGSLVSRVEDLQVLALPLSLLAIAGYLQAILALSGGTSGFIRVASYVPFWSPFVMLTRLTVGRVEPWELVLAYALLVVAIGLTAIVAVRVYQAGVLLYGQRPGLRAIVLAVIRPTA